MTRNTFRFLILTLLLICAFFLIRRASRSPELEPQSVVSQIRQLNQLATVRYTVQKVVGLREEKQPLGSESILLVMQARVEAGIDLSSLRPQDISKRTDGTLVIRMPPAKILNVAVDEKETKVWDRVKTWWTPWVPFSLDLEQRARIEGLDAVRKAALDMGILKDAERHAESSIRALLGLAGVPSVVIIPGSISRQKNPLGDILLMETTTIGSGQGFPPNTTRVFKPTVPVRPYPCRLS